MNSRQLDSLTGPELKAIRRAQGINQTDMGRRIGCSRNAVSHWECKQGPINGHALKRGIPSRILKVLGIDRLEDYPRSTRPRGDGVLSDRQKEWVDREVARFMERFEKRRAKRRQPCGAKTRKGHACKLMSEPGKRRCKFHGGRSTGPRTPEGKARIAAAQRARWQAYRMNANESIAEGGSAHGV